MDIMEVIRGRRSVRAFRPEAPSRALLEQIIAAAGWAPSPHGRQPWRFAVITSAERRAGLAEAMGAEWRAQLALDGQDEATIELRHRRSRERIIGTPVIIVACLYLEDLDVYPDAGRQAAETTMAIQSLGCAIQNMLLAAYALDLDTGWMCAPLFCPEAVRAALGLAPTLQPHALIQVGYAAKEPVHRSRRTSDELVVRWD
ncbi:MAG: nitroreductase family protein [Oscillochloris sp.]|nr:nitroreductase family protein [Oscillochloris sp.]